MSAAKFCSPRPCDKCPFRTDNGFILPNVRVREITSSILRGDSFHCHKTLDYDYGPGVRTDKTMECAGAVIMLEHMERPNQMMRIAERLGFYDRRAMEMDSPVFKSEKHMVSAYKKRNKFQETFSTVTPGEMRISGFPEAI